jgi:dTDP-4-dehydrorhamnose reductase
VQFAAARAVSFASAIIEGLRARGVPLAVEVLIPITTEANRTRAIRLNSIDLGRFKQVFAISPPYWRTTLDRDRELDMVGASLVANKEL